eukprot:m.452173 g.452173  ORF g.452173 m.452173 type:complete len:866 (+) comp20283_c0_seq1:353-2950(+)
MDSREATLQAIFDGVVGEQGRMTIREFRILWQRLSLPFLPDHSTNVMRAFKLIDVEGQGYFQLTQFIERLKPLLEFIELKRDSKSKLRVRAVSVSAFSGSRSETTSPVQKTPPAQWADGRRVSSADRFGRSPASSGLRSKHWSVGDLGDTESQEDFFRDFRPEFEKIALDLKTCRSTDTPTLRSTRSPLSNRSAVPSPIQLEPSPPKLLSTESGLSDEVLLLKGSLMNNEAEIAHLRVKIKSLESSHAATLESAEEQIIQADEDLKNAHQNHAKLKKDYDKVEAETRRLHAVIAEIYADPDHEAHGSKHKGGDSALRSALHQSETEKAEMSTEIQRLSTEIAEAHSAVASQSGKQTISELNDIVDSLREDFLASTAINQRLGLEMESLREHANRIKDRNDELENQLQSKASNRRHSGNFTENKSLAAEIDALNQSYDSSTRAELEDTVRSAKRPQVDRRGSQHRELANCRATINRLTREKAALEAQLAEVGMSDSDLQKFRALTADLRTVTEERQQLHQELDHKQRENSALRFMYKELKRTAVDSTMYAEVREQYERLTRSYSQAKAYVDELETVNSAIQFQLDTMTLQMEHTSNVPRTPARRVTDESLLATSSQGSIRVSDNASEATIDTVVQNMQDRLDENQTNLELQRWKVQNAENDVATLTKENADLSTKLQASERARLAAVELLDTQTDPHEVLRKEALHNPRSVQRRMAELELEVITVKQREVARREETKRIHTDAIVKAAAKIRELEELNQKLVGNSRLGDTPKSSPRYRRGRRSGTTTPVADGPSSVISNATRRKSKVVLKPTSVSGRSEELAKTSKRSDDTKTKPSSASALDRLLQSSSIRPKLRRKRESEAQQAH